MYQILKPTGSIYIHCDTRINHWMRMIMDKIFGYENFLNEINYTYQHFSNSRVKTTHIKVIVNIVMSVL